MTDMDRKHLMDVTCLSKWFPLIKDWVPVPRTIILQADQHALSEIIEGQFGPVAQQLSAQIVEAVRVIGMPAFLRTGHTSGKHRFNRTCYLEIGSDVRRHIYELVEHSEMADMLGLPYDVWAVREYLPVVPLFRMTAYGDMPFVREFRCSVVDGRVVSVNPYWPHGAIEQGHPDNLAWHEIAAGAEELSWFQMEVIRLIASEAAKACEPLHSRWSVDIIDTAKGWYVTDMAAAELSYGWDQVQ